MEKLSLTIQPRKETGKQVQGLRAQGKIPAVLYGHGIDTVNVTVDYAMFEKIYSQAGESTLIDLTIAGKEPVKALIYDVARDPIGNQFIHIDFHQVRMDEKLTTEVPLKFVGEPSAVKELGAIFVTQLDELEIQCLPKDLVHEIELDVSGLKEIDDAIHVRDVKAPAGIEIMNQPDTVVVMVQAPRTEKEVADAAGAAPVSEVPVEGEAEAKSEGEDQPGTAEEKKSE